MENLDTSRLDDRGSQAPIQIPDRVGGWLVFDGWCRAAGTPGMFRPTPGIRPRRAVPWTSWRHGPFVPHLGLLSGLLRDLPALGGAWLSFFVSLKMLDTLETRHDKYWYVCAWSHQREDKMCTQRKVRCCMPFSIWHGRERPRYEMRVPQEAANAGRPPCLQ